MRRAFLALLLSSGLLVLPLSAAAVGAASSAGSAAVPLAAGTCQMTAVNHAGQNIVVSGQGFAASASIAVTTVWGGSNSTVGGSAGSTSTQTITSDASGTFVLTVPAGPGRGGAYTFTATDAACTATIQATAIETAGGLAPPPPTTDTVSGPANDGPAAPAMPVAAIALAVGLLAMAGLIVRPRRRQRAP
jgi:hypothetical protein